MTKIEPTPSDLAQMIEQSNQGNLHRFNKLTTAITDQGVYTQKNINALKEDVDQLKQARNNMMDTIKRLNIDLKDLENEFIKSVTSPVVIHKESWLKRLFN